MIGATSENDLRNLFEFEKTKQGTRAGDVSGTSTEESKSREVEKSRSRGFEDENVRTLAGLIVMQLCILADARTPRID